MANEKLLPPSLGERVARQIALNSVRDGRMDVFSRKLVTAPLYVDSGQEHAFNDHVAQMSGVLAKVRAAEGEARKKGVSFLTDYLESSLKLGADCEQDSEVN